jgi:hypothetical protein
VEGFAPVLRHAKLLGLAGHGEPLVHPKCEALLEKFAEILDPRCQSYIITNGVHLEKHLEALLRMNVVTFNISLNAATAATHDAVMHLGPNALESVLRAIRTLIQLRDSSRRAIQVNISCVVIEPNVHEAAAFVRLGNELRVNNVYLRTLSPTPTLAPGLNYHQLPPSRHPDFERLRNEANTAIAESTVRVLANPETWDAPTFPAPVLAQIAANPPEIIPISRAMREPAFKKHYQPAPVGASRGGKHADATNGRWEEDGANPYGRAARFHCKSVYNCLYINTFAFRITPCCYMSDVPGYESIVWNGSYDFFEAWNSPAMVELRRRLTAGPLMQPCLTCPPML